ncbi:RNA polymerase sigma-70 factor (ECF subfamily) [Chitinophaga polysaccharea]|uniref:RNA polymerase sigma-70 factor (ECF subfamily) n=1 Tax=Chitinophaga polysaccharea TaxID=1293035 RepID=A0A561P752_9BACT|nr:sigma-70 family RNA polymerase sigma factor [Chitinophaga polysaccharea]TWF33943.1 RNA polymerase sigma-70 factor (ECF subfamily) [Chitinophaga polysaccharea]
MALKRIDNEREILELIAGGCQHAFSVLFHNYLNQAGRVVYAIIGSREQTEEILQDLFVKLWNDREKLTTIKDFNAYFFILLRNHTLNSLKSMAADKKKQEQYTRFELMQQEQRDEQADKRLEIFDKAIEALPVQQKTVFLLRVQGYRNPEIATRMNLSTESVKKYNQLALRSIHRFIKVRVTILFTLAALHFLK